LRRSVALLWVAFAAFAAQPAGAQPGLLLGVSEDAFKWSAHAGSLKGALADLDLGAIRYTQLWHQGQTRLTSADVAALDRGVGAAQGLRVVLSVYGSASEAPQDDNARAQYCAYVRAILARYPQIHDVVIWNEVNSSAFWKPQFDAAGSSVAPAAYEALLAACYGPLHTVRSPLNMIASVAPRGNDDPAAKHVIGQDPAAFVRRAGDAYRASRRPVKIFDTFALNVYGLTSAERPWRVHALQTTLSEGDYPRLISALTDAFGGTGQPLPGEGGMTVWYLEDGFQTRVDSAHASAYTGKENDRSALQLDRQGGQLADAIRLAYCQPGVGAFFNFLLADETGLAGWQSGVLWADWTRKPAFAAFQAATHDVRTRSIECSSLPGGDPARGLAGGTP
jgi:hypothetical protein